MTIICPHWIPVHRSSDDAGVMRRWNPPFLKIILDGEDPLYPEDMPPNATLVVRHYPLSELFQQRGFSSPEDARAKARAGVAVCGRIAQRYNALGLFPNSRLLFEGLNEPHLWADEPPALTAIYYAEFLKELHKLGLHGVVGCFGVGWPGNSGEKDAPVQWDFFKPAIDEMRAGDYLGLHEYWGFNGPEENWRWWAGRYEQCPYRVPILVTECGIDLGVVGSQLQYGGWHDLPGSEDAKAKRYVGELGRYEDRCLSDGRIKGVFPFTYDIGSSHWQKFNLKGQVFLNAFFAYIESKPAPKPEPKPEPKPQPGEALPSQETATDAATLKTKVRWWTEEALRQHQAGNDVRAWAILNDLGKQGGLLYRSEQAESGVGLSLGRPLRDGVGSVSQWFGVNPEAYAKFDLKGHNGLDYKVAEGSEVLAAHDGTMTVGEDPFYGKYVIVAFQGGDWSTLYAHLSSTHATGPVKRGQVVGLSGNTGNSTGPHLHFEMRCHRPNAWEPCYHGRLNPVDFRD